MVIPQQWTADLEHLIVEASPGPWSVQRGEDGQVLIATCRSDGKRLYIHHDAEQAPEADVVFIVKARNILPRLLLAVTTEDPTLVADEELRELDDLLRQVKAGPWVAFIESKQPIGGPSMVWVGDEDFGPDMYICLEDKVAPDADIEFIAAAREAVPLLMSEIRYMRGAKDQSGK